MESAKERHDAQVKTALSLFKILRDNKEISKLNAEDRWSLLCKAQPEFTRCYPLICIHMLEDQFHPQVFRSWLERLEKDPGKGMEGYCERQADYAKMLYKKLNTHWTRKEADQVWQNAYDMLKKEQENIENVEKDAKELQEEEREKFDSELRKEFYDYVLNSK